MSRIDREAATPSGTTAIRGRRAEPVLQFGAKRRGNRDIPIGALPHARLAPGEPLQLSRTRARRRGDELGKRGGDVRCVTVRLVHERRAQRRAAARGAPTRHRGRGSAARPRGPPDGPSDRERQVADAASAGDGPATGARSMRQPRIGSKPVVGKRIRAGASVSGLTIRSTTCPRLPAHDTSPSSGCRWHARAETVRRRSRRCALISQDTSSAVGVSASGSAGL